MLGFILSKMNLLILVIAIFAIVAYFMFGLQDIMKITEAQLVLNRVTELSYGLVNSPSYCDSVMHNLPDAIRVSGSSFYYALKISQERVELETGEDLNILIYSMFSRKDLVNAIAADSFRTDATVRIYSKEYLGDDYGADNPVEREIAWVDPQTISKVDSLVLVKEIIAGDKYLYVIPCHSDSCESRKSYVGCLVRGYDPSDVDQCYINGAGFNC